MTDPQIEIPNGWDPRKYQRRAWRQLQAGKKRAVLVWHRRAGKDSMSVNWTASAAFDRVGTYWHMAPTHLQVRKLMWDGIDKYGRRIIDQAFPKALRQRFNDNEMKIELVNGSIWQCVGSDNYNTLVGSNPLGVVFSEWSLADPAAWDYIRPILLENGGWAMFIYTPRGRNHGQSLLELAKQSPDWYWEVLGIEDTGIIPLADIERERRELIVTHGEEDANNLINQEWHCSFDAALRGSYYGALLAKAEKEGRIGIVDHDPSLPVYTAWDLGIGDATAIWYFQLHGHEIAVIDYLENNGVGLVWYANACYGETRWNDDLTRNATPEPLEGHEHRKAYRYRDDSPSTFLPHDAGNSELGTGKRRIDILRLMGFSCQLLKRIGLEDGISAARTTIPRCYFDEDKCSRGLNALRTYRKEYDEKRRDFNDRPAHDWTSHGSDAYRYLSVAIRDVPPPPEPEKLLLPGTAEWLDAWDKLEQRGGGQRPGMYGSLR